MSFVSSHFIQRIKVGLIPLVNQFYPFSNIVYFIHSLQIINEIVCFHMTDAGLIRMYGQWYLGIISNHMKGEIHIECEILDKSKLYCSAMLCFNIHFSLHFSICVSMFHLINSWGLTSTHWLSCLCYLMP